MKRSDMWEDIIDNEHKSQLLFNLYIRWQNEHEYEDIADYLKVIKAQIPTAYGITKRPFGIKIKCNDGNLKVDVVEKGGYLQLKGRDI